MIKKILLIALLLIPCARLSAHPHLYIDTMITVVHGENGIAGFQMRWIFKDLFGNAVILDYDRDRDDEFNELESSLIYDEMFSNIENFNYFLYVYPDPDSDEFLPIEEVTDFEPEIWNDYLVYNFFIPLEIPAKQTEQKLLMYVHDPEVYVSFNVMGIMELYSHDNYLFNYITKRPSTQKAATNPFAPLEVYLQIQEGVPQ